MKNKEPDFNDYIKVASGVYWVGFADKKARFHCNPYLIADGAEALLIDSGSRNDFDTVMLKIMRAGTNPKNIKRLIYQHYDPDLCGNIPHMEAIIKNDELKILSHKDNNIFINYYSPKSPLECIEDMGYAYYFKSGRKLRFIPLPYAHTSGSFATYDEKTKTLFSGDLFGGYDINPGIYSLITEKCDGCIFDATCPDTGGPCQINAICDFHKLVMPSVKALRYAIKQLESLDIAVIAPQHGPLLHTPKIQKIVMNQLNTLEKVGIDRYF